MTKINLKIISKSHTHLQTMTKTSGKFQKDQHKTVGGVAHTRYPLSTYISGDGWLDGQTDGWTDRQTDRQTLEQYNIQCNTQPLFFAAGHKNQISSFLVYMYTRVVPVNRRISQ